MPSKLIVLPTEMAILKHSIGKKRNGKAVAGSEHDSEPEQAMDSDSLSHSDGERDAVFVSRKRHTAHGEHAVSKTVRSEASNSSDSGGGETTSKASASSSVKKLVVTTTARTARKPTAWEIHRRKQASKNECR